jgi:hypothetical protein
MNIKEQMEKYFEREYKETVDLLTRKQNWVRSEKEVIFNPIQRCLGVVQFVQYLGVSYEDTNSYDYYREKLENLLKK